MEWKGKKEEKTHKHAWGINDWILNRRQKRARDNDIVRQYIFNFASARVVYSAPEERWRNACSSASNQRHKITIPGLVSYSDRFFTVVNARRNGRSRGLGRGKRMVVAVAAGFRISCIN